MQKTHSKSSKTESDPAAKNSVLALILAFLAACASAQVAEPSDEATAKDYAPLEIGASWNYEMNYLGQSGEMKVELVAEKDGYVVDNRNGSLKHTEEGLRDKDRYLIRNPLKAGAKWKAVVGPSAVEHAEIVSVGEPCDTKAGRFGDCLVVHGWMRRDDKTTLHIEWTWARGVGLARVETTAEIRGQGRVPQTRQVLRSYALERASAAEPASLEADGAPSVWE